MREHSNAGWKVKSESPRPATSRFGHLGCALHQRFPLGPSTLPSAEANKSISSACWPIFGCNSLTFGPSCFGQLTEEKTPAVPQSSRDFHYVICFGRTSSRSANSANVASPLSAARVTTFALMASE